MPPLPSLSHGEATLVTCFVPIVCYMEKGLAWYTSSLMFTPSPVMAGTKGSFFKDIFEDFFTYLRETESMSGRRAGEGERISSPTRRGVQSSGP